MLNPITCYSFRKWLMGLAIFLVVITLGFPFILKAVLVVSSCSGIGGACGAVAVVAGMFLKPLLILIAIAVGAFATFKRTVDSDLSRYWVFFAAVTIWITGEVLYTIGNFWGALFAVGIISNLALYIFPLTLLPMVVFGILLSLDIEGSSGFKGSISSIKGPFGLPAGRLYSATAIWLCAVVGLDIIFLIGAFVAPMVVFQLKLLIAKSVVGFLLGTILPIVLNVITGILVIITLKSKKPDIPAQYAPTQKMFG